MRINAAKLFINLTIISIVLFFFQSCSPSSKVVMVNKFQEKEIFGKKLAVNIQKQDVSIEEKYKLNSFLGDGDLPGLLANYVASTLSVRTKYLTTFSKVSIAAIQIGSGMDNLFYLQMYPSSNGGALQIREPREGTFIPTGKDTVDYILFIDHFRIETDHNTESTTTPGPMGRGMGMSISIEPSMVKVYIKFQCYLWDNRAGRKAFYATIANSINNGKVFSGSDLNSAIDKCLKDIFGDTPFKNYKD